MHKITKLFKGVFALIKKPSLINLILESEAYWSAYLNKKHPLKNQLQQVHLDDLIPHFDETLHHFSFLGGGSLPTDIMLLKGISNQISNCAYFEIGTWRGESVLNVAENAKECYTLNLSKKQILALGLSKKYATLHGFLSKGTENITHLTGDSLTYDFGQLQKKFDLIFIDGNHTYDFVKNDTKKVFSHLVHDASIVIWHDYASDPETVRSEVLCGILEGIPNDCKENLYHVANTLCAIYYPKDLKSIVVDFPVQPSKRFEVRATLKKSLFK
jgi:predicted O-methyltransferase YrrM